MAKVLLVDDDRNILFLLSETLKKDKYDLSLANNGEAAIKKIEEGDFDLIISDLQMPVLDGIDVLKAAKRELPDAEVLIVTGHGSIKSAVRAMKLGAFEYLSKPIDVEELRLKAAQALKHRDLIRRLKEQQQEINEFNEMIQRDLKLAEQVQQSLVPEPFKNDRIEIGLKYLPMIELGGDFADIYYDGKNHVYLTLVDVTGHGISAALLVNRISSEVRKLVREQLEPREILFQLNNFIIDVFDQTGFFLTAFTNKIDIRNATLTYAGSSHPSMVLWENQQGEFKRIESQNVIIGFEKVGAQKFLQDKIQLFPGDKIFLYTDGIIEAEDEKNQALGINGFVRILNEKKGESAGEITHSIIQRLHDLNYNKIRDDIFLIATDFF